MAEDSNRCTDAPRNVGTKRGTCNTEHSSSIGGFSCLVNVKQISACTE